MSAFMAVLWKELQETVLQRRGINGQTIPLSILILLGGVVTPLLLHMAGVASKAEVVVITGSITMVFMVMGGILYAVSTAVDAIAGERERHTLETLIASPASDAALVTGKILAIVLVGFLTAVVLAVVSSATLLVMYGPDDASPHLVIAVLGPFASIPAALFMASLAFLISYKAKTVKTAQSVLGLTMFPLFMVFGFAAPLAGSIDRVSPGTALVTVVVGGTAALVLPALLFVLAVMRFRRDRILAP